MRLRGTLQAKGVRGLMVRPGLILSRFGPTAGPMDRRLSAYADVAERHGAGLTIPVTAAVLARHPALIRRFVERGVEFAIHGLYHNDHSLLGLQEQRESIARAAAAFKGARVPFAGFRGPYLRYNQATNTALSELGLLYHSSQAVAFAVPGEHNGDLTGYHRAMTYYRANLAAETLVRPEFRDGLVHIPVALPDDEVMVDRLHFDDEAQTEAWLAVLEATHSRGEVFTVQLHPERIYQARHALDALLMAAAQRQPRVWLATLEQIASWWIRRRAFRVEVTTLGPGRFRLELTGDADASLVVRGAAATGLTPWHGQERIASERRLDLDADRKPVIGISPRTPPAVRDMLVEEGFPVETADSARGLGAYVDVAPGDWSPPDVLAAVERGPGPLCRVWRWPGSARSALAVSGDLDSITLQDFALRSWETRHHATPDS